MRRKANSRKIKEKVKFGETIVLRTLRLEGSKFKVELNINEPKIIWKYKFLPYQYFLIIGLL